MTVVPSAFNTNADWSVACIPGDTRRANYLGHGEGCRQLCRSRFPAACAELVNREGLNVPRSSNRLWVLDKYQTVAPIDTRLDLKGKERRTYIMSPQSHVVCSTAVRRLFGAISSVNAGVGRSSTVIPNGFFLNTNNYSSERSSSSIGV